MSTLRLEKGFDDEWQRTALDLRDQRTTLAGEAARFDEWRARWNERQSEIDGALEQLKQKLAGKTMPSQ